MNEQVIAAMREANDRINRGARRRVMLVELGDGAWRVEDDTPTGVAPQSTYPDATKAAARLLQLLGIKTAVEPQGWPEAICVGVIEHEGDAPTDPEWQS